VTGDELKNARKASAWTQAQAAARLGVTQAYLSMVERGERAVSSELASKAVEVFEVPATSLPLTEYRPGAHDAGFFPVDAGKPGLSGIRLSAQFGPIESGGSADGGVGLGRSGLTGHRGAGMAATGLPASELGLADRECKVAGSTEPAWDLWLSWRGRPQRREGHSQLEEELAVRVAKLEPSRLVKEDTLCRESMTRAERAWLRDHRPKSAEHWNLLTDLTVEQLDHVAL
jgi:transcriptional regulator with XRE-family HTH domain